MSHICKKYPGDCVVEEVFCSKRYKKALDSPDEGGLEFCRSCDSGKTAWEALKVEAAKQPLCNICGHPMKNINGGMCTPCQVKTAREKAKIQGEEKEESTKNTGGIMGNRVTSSKVCIDCGQEYKPTSNVQKRCSVCIPIHIKKSAEKYKENKAVKTHVMSAKSQASQTGVTRAINKGRLTQGIDIGPKVGRASEPEILICTDYVIKVDFVRYPKLHERLLKMSEDDIRTPGDQLMFLIRNTLSDMEAQA
jgi:hypothetical protein